MTHLKKVVESGQPLHTAKKALIMLHGRGASAHDILSLKEYLPLDDFYIIAPEATNFTWYPYSFLAPISQNEPWLASALDVIKNVADDISHAGIGPGKTFILGFSQGACLALEFATRHAQQWGGVVAFTGGLIGDKIYSEHYHGNFQGTPVWISNSENDPHVPLARSEDSKNLMASMGAAVALRVYPGRPHTILQEELDGAGALLR
jgi:phospholipase/carboxylesterase